MEAFVKVLELAVLLFLEVMGYVIVIRSLLSWFASEDSKVLAFCYTVSEPVIAPVRSLLNRIPALEESIIDFSPVVAFLFLTIIRIFLLSVI